MGQCVPVPATGMVSKGMGMVWQLPTLSIPVRHPIGMYTLAHKLTESCLL